MKVLLISPFFENPSYPLYLPSESLGLGYLASYLRMHDIEVDILDANMLGLLAEEVAAQARKLSYQLIGISVSFHLLIEEASRISMKIKKDLPSIHITIGGHFATMRHKQILQVDHNIDSVVRRDGEETLLEVVKALDKKKSLENIKGLSFRNRLGNVIVNDDRALCQNLDEFPYPARDTLQYVQELGHSWPTQILSSRGCYGNCTFCDIRAFYGGKWRARSAIKVVDEIEWLIKEFGSKVFRFTDDEFIGPKPYGPAHARRIASEIIRRGLTVELMIDARPQAVDKDLFKLLKEAGAIDCLIGVESGVDRILKLYNKGSNVSYNLRAMEILNDLGISLNLAFIMFDPRMTLDELRQNYHFLLDNDIVTVDSLRSWLWPLFGTSVVEQLRADELVIAETLECVKYRFLDNAVGKVFQIVSICSKITYSFDRALFSARKFKRLTLSDLDIILEANKTLWIDIFETALTEYEGFDFVWVEKKVNSLMKKMRCMELSYK